MSKSSEPRLLIVLGGYKVDLDNGGRLMRDAVDLKVAGDYGADPLGDGTFRMVPSGDVVSYDERCARLKKAG